MNTLNSQSNTSNFLTSGSNAQSPRTPVSSQLSKNRTCRCGSATHKRPTYSKCPLNSIFVSSN